jgi:Cu+-exporting ATPase
MHREYRPEEMQALDADPFALADGATKDDGARRLYLFTALLGLLIGAHVFLDSLGLSSALSWIAAILGAIYIVYGALEALFRRQIGADFALAQACVAALLLRQPFVAAEVVFIALVGEVLEALTFARTKRALGRLVDQSPRTARVRRDEQEMEIPARNVSSGDLVIVKPGERIPVDGPVESGRSTVDQSALTGESIPVDKGPADPVFTGTLNQFGMIEVRAEKVGRETTFGQVVSLVSRARQRKADLERVADRLARYFLPAVEIAAGLTLLAGYLLGWSDVWTRAVAVLVVACPCALVLATPAAMLASMAWLARHGVLIKGGYALERLAACDTFAFDKTGTLTIGKPAVSSLVALPGRDETDVLRLAASAESASHHPLALAVAAEARRRGLDLAQAGDVRVLPGAGIEARIAVAEGHPSLVFVGNQRLLSEHGLTVGEHVEPFLKALDDQGETPLIVAVDGQVAGLIGVRDTVRVEAHDVVHDLKHLKIRELAVLTGDREQVARRVAMKVHIKTVEAGLSPADKARWIKKRQEAGHTVAMVGDGINDAPALAQADAGIALGGIGGDLAAEAGDLIILGDPLRNLPALVELSRATVIVIRQNIIGFAFGLNAVAVLLASLGILGPVAAAVLHQIGSLLVLLNAMRLLLFGDLASLPPFRWLTDAGARIRRLDDAIDFQPIANFLSLRRRKVAAGACILAVLLYAASGIRMIAPEEVGVAQRFGGFREVMGPGLHVGFPTPIDRVTHVAPDLVRSLELGFRRGRAAEREPLRWESRHGRDDGTSDEGSGDALLVTGDGRYLELTATLQYSVNARRPESVHRFALQVAGLEAVLQSLGESTVRAELGRRPLLELLTAGRAGAESAAAERLRARLSVLDTGVRLLSITFQDVHPPLAVIDAYRDVSRAESDRQRRINEAEAYRAEKLGDAEGRAKAIANAALGERDRLLASASSRADAFGYLLESRQSAPALTDFRLFWEVIAEVMAGRPKLILEGRPDRPQRLILSRLPLEQAAILGGGESRAEPARAATGTLQQEEKTPSPQ